MRGYKKGIEKWPVCSFQRKNAQPKRSRIQPPESKTVTSNYSKKWQYQVLQKEEQYLRNAICGKFHFGALLDSKDKTA